MDIRSAEQTVEAIVADLRLCLEKAKKDDEAKGGNTDHNSNGWIDWIKSASESYWT